MDTHKEQKKRLAALEAQIETEREFYRRKKKCGVCKRYFNTCAAWDAHMVLHDTDTGIHCDVDGCIKLFPRKADVTKHKKADH